MSIDNPLDQVVALIESEDRQNAPDLADQIAKFIGGLPLPGALAIVKLIRYEKEKHSIENSALLMKIVVDELRRVGADVSTLGRDSVTREEVRRLTLDASSKADDLRDRKRVERIGKILAHAITLAVSNFDKAEEMMRVARDLSDQDVLGLRHLYDTQFESLRVHGLNFDINETNRIWRENLAADRIPGVLKPEWLSIFLKIQGLGLATSVERIETEVPPNEQVFALLPKGADFVRYIQGAVGTDSSGTTMRVSHAIT